MIWEGGAKHDVYEYLIHSGIRGQKWGIRRFQNKDGTWTAEGKKRRAVKEGYSDKPNKKSKDETKKEKIDISKMSDDELRSRINRMQLEEQYKQYLAKANPKKKSKVKEVMSKLAENAAMTIGNKAVESIANKMFAKSNPKKKPIDLDSLTPEKLKKMNKDELDEVNAYADAIGNKAVESIANKMFAKSNPKKKPIDLDSLTPEKLKKMNKDELDEVNAYADAIGKARKIVEKNDKIEVSMKERISDISNVAAYQKAGEAYFNSLASENASSDEKAYYKWLGENSMTSRHY